MITAQVDFSAHLGVARDQGQRPTCLVFAGSDLNAAANGVGHLSAEYLCHHAARLAGDWQPGRGFQLDHVIGAVCAPGQPFETQYPYRPDSHDAPLIEPKGSYELYACPTARRQDMNAGEVMNYLTDGKPVGLVVQVCQAMMLPQNGVINFDPLIIPDQYHAVVGVGVGTGIETGEQYVLLRNSWGTSWGLDGHAWMPAKLLEILLVEGFLI